MTPARRFRRALLLALLSALLLAACGGGSQGGGGGGATLNWYVFEEPSGSFEAAAKACSEGKDYTVRVQNLPADADQQREQLARRLAAGDPAIDLIGMDVIWTSEFAQAGWVEPWGEGAGKRVTDGVLEAAAESARFEGKVWGAPYTSNAQLLWYRTDLVDEPPATWDELLDMAKKLADEDKPHLIQAQGQRYEGLTVFFVTMVESAGGTILDGEDLALPEGPTTKVLETLKDYATSPAAPPGLSTSLEDDGRLAFEEGDSAFMLNYPFVWPSAQENAPKVAENMGWARLPSLQDGEESKVTLGGLNIGVSSFSTHRDQAFEAAECIAKPENQLTSAVDGGLPPSATELYDDQKVKDAFPFAEELRATLEDAVLRPVTPAYADVSLAITRSIHPLESIEPEADYVELQEKIELALESKGLL